MLTLAGKDPQALLKATLELLKTSALRDLYDVSVRRLLGATLVEPGAADVGTDRSTCVLLSPEEAATASSSFASYGAWLEDQILQHSDYMSQSDANLLRATAVDIRSFILMKRRGQDVTVEMYKQFYCLELAELLLAQDRVLCALSSRAESKNMTRVRRHFSGAPLTMGVEEEYQIVSTETWELVNDAEAVIESTAGLGKPTLTREVYKSQVEFSTGIHDNIGSLALELKAARATLHQRMPAGLTLASAGTHPFSVWNVQKANESARTTMFMHDMQDVVRRLVTFGMHVHIGLDDRELAIDVLNASRSYLPLFLALSCSSPFWESRLTGLMSYRSTVFAVLPRTGIPPAFGSHREFMEYLTLLAETKAFDSAGTNDPTKIWWDVRLHPKIPTIEFRIADACTTAADTLCVAAMCQALVAKLVKLRHGGTRLAVQSKRLIEENKWRATRYGCGARFIDPQTGRDAPARYFAMQFMDLVDDVLPDLGSRKQVERMFEIFDGGSSAKDQVDCFRSTGALPSVVSRVASRFLEDIDPSGRPMAGS